MRYFPMPSPLRSVLSLMAVLCLGLAPAVRAQWVDDVLVRYSRMAIQDVTLAQGRMDVAFFRHNLDVAVGRGPVTLGLTYQLTDTGTPGQGTPEQGLMLTGSYGRLLSHRLRLEARGRLGLTPGIDYGQPLYATDTDLNVNLVAFHPEGVMLLRRRPVYPSAYVGGIVNRFGRWQGIGGAGAWWNQVGLYLTAFYAFNGVADPSQPGPDAAHAFAKLQNAGISGSVSYEWQGFLLGLRRNWALRNGGNDLTLTLQYRHFFR